MRTKTTSGSAQDLAGQVIAVTGAARGIGLAIARQLAEAGARVAISDIDASALTKASAEFGFPLSVQLDVTDGVAFGHFLDRVEREVGPLDALVNNAGIMPTGGFLDESDELTARIIAINTTAMIIGSKRALERMVPRGRGHVVNLSSTMGMVPLAGLATYCASKAAVMQLGEVLAAEFAKSGVLVSTILPGAVRTELIAGLDVSAAVSLPGGRTVNLVDPLEPDDVAKQVRRVLAAGRSEPMLVVPRRLGRLLRTQDFMPRRAKRRVAERMGSNEQILGHTDDQQRASYRRRVEQTGGSR